MMKWSAAAKRDCWFILIVVLVCAALGLLPGAPHLETPAGRTVRGRVTAVDDSGLTRHGLVRFGSQKLTVEVNGETFAANNELRGQLELDKVFVPGDAVRVVVQAGDRPGESMLTAQDYDRNFWSLTLFAAFCVLLCVFGGWTGGKALMSFIFSCMVIWKVVVPLALRGYPASWIIFGAVCLLTAVIIFLVAGISRKGIAAFAGAISGVLAGLLMAHGFGRLMDINGAAMPYAQTLLYSGSETLDLQDIFIGAMVLASSGAVMDLGMDIAAGVEEVARHSPRLSGRELAMSGMRIGRSVVGTMTTTLLLAYSGGYLTLLMMFASQGTSVPDFLNNPLVAAELVKTLIGSFSLVLVAPFTALISGWVFRPGRTVST
ncbi:MAG: YibE/F family protein [Lentisphaeria bacterium]|nr:YibE/F family protein [Lentisphaeria bacterium]